MVVSQAYQELNPSAARRASLVERPLTFWALALFSLALFLQFEVKIFLDLSDLTIMEADDGLRLQQIRDLLAGQGWFDLHQYRYLPPDGTLMHWSRLVDAPIAALILLFRPLVGHEQAEILVLLVWPLLLLAAYIATTTWVLSKLFNARAAALAVVVGSNLLAFRHLFSVSELDHHNLQTLLILGSAICFAFANTRRVAAPLGGAFSALSLAIGLESLPFVAVIALIYTFAWIADPRQLRAFALFAASLALGSLAAFLIQTPPARWLVPACDVLAPPLLLIVGGGFAIACGAALAGTRLSSWRARFAAASAGGVVLIGVFLISYPACLEGPYHAVPESIRAAWLGAIGESFTLPQMLGSAPVRALMVVGPTLAAAIAAWIGVIRTEGERRRLLLAAAVLLTLTFLMCVVQIRAIYVGCAFIPIAAGWALDRLIAATTGPRKPAARPIALLVAGLFFFDASWAMAARLAQQINLLPTARFADHESLWSCFTELPKINALPAGVILGPLDLGAHILFLTHHSMISAGYHRNVEGILAGIRGFSGSEEDMRDFVVRDRADYVALCLPWIDQHPDRYGPFAKALAAGAAVPWLEPVPLDAGSLMLWRVRPEAQLRP